jgi:hypothetical protein
MKSFTPKSVVREEFAQGLDVIYSKKRFLAEVIQLYVGRDFNAETGYVPRHDFMRAGVKATYRFYPDKGTIENHGVTAELDNYLLPVNLKLTDRSISGIYFFNFRNRIHLEFKSSFWYVLLRQDFDPTNKGIRYLHTGSEYRWTDFSFLFNSDNRKRLRYDFSTGYGGYFNGNRWFIQGALSYRYQPYGYISLVYSYNELKLPMPWENKGFWLIGPKLDITFTDKLFLTTYVQYNQQSDNLNINARFQWRYKPVSDLFLVYTDNYFPESGIAKNRALVLKLSYWFN